MVNIGDPAPDFTLQGASGNTVTLSDLRGKQRAVLVFYPKDMTSGCANQLSAIRDSINDFRAMETEPFGINPGDAASHQEFIKTYAYPFDLLVDEDRRVAQAYGAVKPDGSGIQRTVVVVGKDGRIIFRAAGAPPPVDLLAAILSANDAPEGEPLIS